jgi:RNA polymerase sigma-70 factor (ECF subfamily)
VISDDREQTPGAHPHARVAEAFRQEYARVVASVLRIARDIDLPRRSSRKPSSRRSSAGPAPARPINRAPGCSRPRAARAIDRLRRSRARGLEGRGLAYETALTAGDEVPDVTDPETIADDRLRLVFTCCHPGLPPDSRSPSP